MRHRAAVIALVGRVVTLERVAARSSVHATPATPGSFIVDPFDGGS